MAREQLQVFLTKMHWLNANAGAVQAISSIVIVVLTAVLATATICYVFLTQRMTTAAGSSIKQTRDTFQATHRPFIAIDVSLDIGGPGSLMVDCTASNVGNDEALGLQIELGSMDDLYHALIPFGDLLPNQKCTIGTEIVFGGALARFWHEELDRQPAISIRYKRVFKSRDGRPRFEEHGVIMHDPARDVLTKIQSLATRQ